MNAPPDIIPRFYIYKVCSKCKKKKRLSRFSRERKGMPTRKRYCIDCIYRFNRQARLGIPFDTPARKPYTPEQRKRIQSECKRRGIQKKIEMRLEKQRLKQISSLAERPTHPQS